MDFEEYRRRGKEMVDYIADYLENIRDRRVHPDVKPGYMRSMVPEEPPVHPEGWDDIMRDFDTFVMAGVTHWQSPHMHAYFPALTSFPALLGEMLSDAMDCIGFTWASSPANTELEILVMNWLGRMIGLPDEFLYLSQESTGGGVIQTSCSEATLVCQLAARTEALRRCREEDKMVVASQLVAYCSDQAHSSVEKAGLIGMVTIRKIETDKNLSLRADKLEEAIARDRADGLIPFFLCVTLGTTGACAFDNLSEVAPICRDNHVWLHVDAAYAGNAFICPEFRPWLNGVELADSIAINPGKWLLVNCDCTAMWVKDSAALHRTFDVDPLYLKHENSSHAIDFMHWQIPLSRRFRALKLWFVIRNYGVTGLQKHIRKAVATAKTFEALILSDLRFEVPATRHLGMVVFRLVGENLLTERLLKKLNSRGKLYAVPADLKGTYVVRFTVTSQYTTDVDIAEDWQEIREVADEVLKEESGEKDVQHGS